MAVVTEKLLVIVCPSCGEPDLVPFAVDGLVGRCNVCGGTFVIQGEIVPIGFSCALDPVTGLRPVAAAPVSAPKINVPFPPAPVDHAGPPAEPAAAPSASAPAAERVAVVTHSDHASTKPRQRAVLWVTAAAVLLVLLIVGRGIIAPSDGASPRDASATAGTLGRPLSESDNGYAWNRADYASRIALCETFARNTTSTPRQPAHDAKYFYDTIHAFYNANPQAPILQLAISQPAKLGGLTDRSR
jgi:hypothetical protein